MDDCAATNRPRRTDTTGRRLGTTALALVLVAALIAAGCSKDKETSTGSTKVTSGGTATTVASTSNEPLDSATAASLQKALDDTRAQAGFPGVSAGVWTPEGEWIGTSGTQGEGKDTPIAIPDHTRIGSITKTFTVTLLLQLEEQGKLSLDDTIEKYVPGIPNGDVATLRQLADMSSGIPDYTANQAFLDILFSQHEKEWKPQELVDYAKGQTPYFAPGQGWRYTDTNTVLLGMVIEQVTGKSFADVLKEGIIDPLGLKGTSFPIGTEIADPHLYGITSQGQPEGKTADATFWNPSYSFSAGQMISTFDDLHTWADALRTGEGILDPKTEQEREDSLVSTKTGKPVTSDTEDGYGLGYGRRDGWWGHIGEVFGFNTLLQFLPDGTTIIIIVNSDVDVPGTNPPESPAPYVFAALVKALDASSSSSGSTATTAVSTTKPG